MFAAVLLSFAVIFVAELGDKSQLMALTFALRYRWWVVLAGITAATTAVHIVSVAVGHFLGAALPTHLIGIVAGIAFVFFGLWTLRGDSLTDAEEDKAQRTSAPAFFAVMSAFMLAELGDNRARFATAEGLQAYAGTAPVTFQSGQIEKHLVRRACQPFLRSALHLWADRSRLTCAWADDYYRAHRAKGQSHACALRCLGQRWVKILWKMWQTSTPYDEARHLAEVAVAPEPDGLEIRRRVLNDLEAIHRDEHACLLRGTEPTCLGVRKGNARAATRRTLKSSRDLGVDI